MKKILIILFGCLFCSTFVFAQAVPQNSVKSTPAPLQESSYGQAQIIVLVQRLQQRLVDLQSLIALQGKQIQTLAGQQQKLYSDLNNKISMLEDKVSDKPSSVLPLLNPSQKTSKPVAPAADAAQYQAAYNLMKARQYAEAIQSFNQYVDKLPNGYYISNAHYWLGELYAIAGDNDHANMQLLILIHRYPKSNKVPEAMLKMGSMAYDQKQYEQAKSWWQKLVNKYPKSASARIATTSLQQLAKVD